MRETIEAETAEDLKIFNYNFRKQVLKNHVNMSVSDDTCNAKSAESTSVVRSLYSDTDRYLQSFGAFLKDSDEHDAIINWITK